MDERKDREDLGLGWEENPADTDDVASLERRLEQLWAEMAEVARALDLLFLSPGTKMAALVVTLAAERDRLLRLVAGEKAPPTRQAIQEHHAAHGGHWLVSAVNNAGTMDREPDLRPMVLRLIDTGDGFIRATIPGTDYGGRWQDADPWRLMPDASWTRLDAAGRLLGAPTPEGA
jgi:hypothetical protein